MANTFFGFNTALNDHGERLGSSPEDIEGLEAEEEYDALNDETFGTLENDLDDWEVQHEQLAEIAESSRHSNDIESFLDNLGLSDEDSCLSKDKNVWAYELKNGEKPAALLETSIKLLPNLSSHELLSKSSHSPNLFNQQQQQRLPNASCGLSQRPVGPPKLQTVEELERMLLNQAAKPVGPQINQQPGFQHPNAAPPRFPPGFHFPGNNPVWQQPPIHPPNMLNHPHHHMQQQQQQHPLHGPNLQHIPPPGLMRMMGPPPPHNRMPPPPPPHMMGPGPPPGFMYGRPPHPNHPNHPNSGFPMNPHFNFPQPPPARQLPPGINHQPQRFPNNLNMNNNINQKNCNNQQQLPQQQQQQQQQGSGYHQSLLPSNNRNNHWGGGDTRDEYAGLMNNREKQWLLNIQLLQVNTGTPYFDDYYYTVFKERQSKNKENQPEQRNNNQRYHNNRYQHQQQQQQNRDGNSGHHRNSMQETRQDNTQNPLNKKVYTPLQFENSLGKLQFGSVTAPRKIIDMDIITLEKDSENTNSTRDSRKTKQLLLELEALYTLILKAEDLKNPVAIQNTEKLVELKQKQRLREIDAAQTPEQKQEILKLLQQESVAPIENQAEVLGRIITALLQDEKLQSFLGIRKGKMLLLRVLPHLTADASYLIQLLELWTKFLLSIPVVGRRDSIGDNILIRFHPLFKKFINNVTDMDQILELVLTLIEIIKLENNSRSTPLSHQSKSPLHFILQNKFGVSAISSILQRADALMATCTEKQSSDWSNFLASLIDTLLLVGTGTITPIEPITELVLNRHADKLTGISQDKRQLFERTFVDSN